MNLAEWLARAGRLGPGSPAILSGERLMCDNAEFARAAGTIGANLRARQAAAVQRTRKRQDVLGFLY